MQEPKTLAELNLANIERAKFDRHLAFTTYPDIYHKLHCLLPVSVKILMVTDGGGGYGNSDFHLRELLDVLSVSPGPWVRFAVTKAHRAVGTDTSPNMNNFRFHNHDLSKYDQIWLFGVERSSNALSQDELKALSQFMDQGGGVFATGDHENLGFAMCAEVPRVRSMRKWSWPGNELNGEPAAPPGTPGLASEAQMRHRHDTLREGNEAGYQFDDQSDNTPQRISPNWYYAPGPSIFRQRRYPHPVLCGPRGVITVLPDHAHEGECYVPQDLTRSYTFAGYAVTEYPALPGGQRLAPEVVARATVIPGHTTVNPNKPPVYGKTFGVISAYDGHRLEQNGKKLGRVVCDATWHHFFNINLVGDPGSPDPEKRKGFDYAPAPNPDPYEDIKSYFRNIAVWLARPEKQAAMLHRALWCIRWRYPLLEELPVMRKLDDLRLHADWSKIIAVGTVARDALGRLASRCQSLEWVIRIPEIIDGPRWVHPLDEVADPWLPHSPKPGPDPVPWMDAELLPEALLGGVMLALASEFPELDEESAKRAERDIDKALRMGTKLGLSAFQEMVEHNAKGFAAVQDVLSDMLRGVKESPATKPRTKAETTTD